MSTEIGKSPVKADPWIGSAVWGRIGGAVLILAAFVLQGTGVEFGAEDQQAAFGAVESGLAAAGVIMSIVSKCRQKKAESKAKAQAGSVAVVLVAAMLVSGLLAVSMVGCANNQSATQQIMSETSDPLAITRAVYLDARRWYNDAQQTFIDSRAALSPEKQRQYNELLDEISLALDVWGESLALGKLYDIDKEEFRKAKNKLIDAGFILLAGD